jgi:hypothetical protein
MALITIRRYRDLSEAIVARSLLESCGIDASLGDENLVRLAWQLSNLIGGIALQVEAEDEAEAIEVLDSPIPESFNYGDESLPYTQPHCPRCDSTDITFQGASRTAALMSLYALSLPLPPGHETWICNNCECRWEEIEDEGSSNAG